MELLQFVFSSFWVWLGCVVLIVAAGEAVATAAAGFRQKRKVSVYHVGHFGQEASFCNHPQCPPPGPLLFYGKTAPRYCPLKKKERK